MSNLAQRWVRKEGPSSFQGHETGNRPDSDPNISTLDAVLLPIGGLYQSGPSDLLPSVMANGMSSVMTNSAKAKRVSLTFHAHAQLEGRGARRGRVGYGGERWREQCWCGGAGSAANNDSNDMV